MLTLILSVSLFTSITPVTPVTQTTLTTYTPKVQYSSNITVLENTQYRTYYNTKLRSPVVTLEILEPKDFKGTETRAGLRFRVDPRVNTLNPLDFKYSGYDRGHLAAAANTSNILTLRDSFLMSNVVAQRPKLNRGAWRELEEYVRNEAKVAPLEVVTGAIYNCHSTKYIGLVPVPEKFFKSIKYQSGITRTWVLPNTSRLVNFRKYELRVHTSQPSLKGYSNLCDVNWRW